MKIVPMVFLVSLTMCFGLMACDNGAQTKEKSSGAKNKEAGDETDDSSPGTEGEETVASADFDSWCEKAAEVDTVGKKLGDLFEHLCDGGVATSLMKGTMISKAYAGSGTPKLTSIEPIKGDKTYSTALFAVGIKLPIDIKTHFNKVGPKAGDKAAQEKLAEANGATAEFEIQDEYKNDGKYHVRGWKVYSKVTKKIAIIKIITESVVRSDQFELADGKAYLYTQYILDGIEGVKDFSLLTAGIKTEKGSYLLTIAKIKVNNKGQPELAEGQITDTAKELIKSMHKSAAEAK